MVAFVVYLSPGVLKNPTWNLNALSGFPPPFSYSIYNKEEKLTIFKDFGDGLAYAKQNNKPIMIDFTGWACVNCREMEERVWTQPLIEEMLINEYVIISLYVDDREKLPDDQQFTFLKDNGSAKNIRTIGDKWSTFQTLNFNNNSQPYYVLLNSNYELLNSTTAKTDADDYYNWLKTGLENFNKNKTNIFNVGSIDFQ
jgi:thiol:disulfide interchange protein DsbD